MDSPLQVGGLIHLLRGLKVILDKDLARLYGVTTGNLNKAVRRNQDRFPSDFMIKLTPAEYRALRFQIGILEPGRHSKYIPIAFTEQGVAMLSGVLRSRKAAKVNIAIMRAFVRLREAAAAHGELVRRLAEMEGVLIEHGSQLGEHARLIQEGFEAIRGLMEAPGQPDKRIGFQHREEAPGTKKASRLRRGSPNEV